MMKRFKFGLVGILLGIFGLISFSNAGSVEFTGHVNVNKPYGGTNFFYIPSVTNSNIISDNSTFSVNCTFNNITNDFVTQVTTARITLNGYSKSNIGTYTITNSNNTLSFSWRYQALIYVGFVVVDDSSVVTSFDYDCTISGDKVGYNCPACEECQTCPEINTGDILSGSCDTNYCVENDLCPVASNFSQLFINDIEHQSAPLINITIPYEYSWDSSVDSGQFDLVISGQNVDYEYIDNIVRTQNSKPTTEDFNNIITGLIPLFIPGLVIILFIWFVFKFIKKIF